MLPNMVECVDVAQINIKVQICWEFGWVMPSWMPFMNGSIELLHLSVLGYIDITVLTAVATRATIRIGTSCFNIPSSPIDVGKWLYVYFSARSVALKKKKNNNILFESIYIESSAWTKIQLLYNQDDPGIAIGMCAQWKPSKQVTLTELESA